LISRTVKLFGFGLMELIAMLVIAASLLCLAVLTYNSDAERSGFAGALADYSGLGGDC